MSTNIKYACLILLYILIGISETYSQDRFLGYFANVGTIPENSDHTNYAHIWAAKRDKTTATNMLISNLNDAKNNNIKAIIMVDTFLFDTPPSSENPENTGCPYSLEVNSSLYFSQLVNTLIFEGYLIPNNPELSTVAGFYPVDEPELCGLKDQGGNPHSALQNAVNTIRNNADTSNFPIVTIASKNYQQSLMGLRLFDWVGMNWYDKSTSDYLTKFDLFSSSLSSNQRTILVPQASFGGTLMSQFGPWHDPDIILNRYLVDQNIIGIVPFLWDHQNTDGTKDIPELLVKYTAIGNHIKNGDPLPLIGSLGCSNQGGGLFECTSNADRGTPPYDYSWHGAAASYGNTATYFISCGVNGIQARVTITDSASEQINLNTSIFCDSGTVIKTYDGKGD